MNVLNKFTLRSLKLNKKRTIVTIIGIILSTALICAVAGVFSSFQQTLINHAIINDGDYHSTFFDVDLENQKYITKNREVKSYFITQGAGYSYLKDSKNSYKPYLYLMEFDDIALKNFGIQLDEGRMPQNTDEIIISKNIEENGGVKYGIGDIISLDVSKRLSEGCELNQNNPYTLKDENNYIEENLEKIYTKNYKVVGIFQRPNLEIEPYSAPGYTVITLLDKIKDKANISVKFNNIKDTYELTKDIERIITNSGNSINTNINNELMKWSGVIRSDDTVIMLYSLMSVVIVIIIVSSVFVIRNSFAISITEKMKQYGMLSSIGATKKQIKKSVIFEGLILGIIGIPLGILFGVIATYILIRLTALLIGNSLENIVFVFRIPLIAILASILLSAITIYLSSISSARKASKISPIEAIRSNQDIKIKSKKLKTPRIIKKLFGIGGEIAYKNLKRNKKKYRTTVISLVVSITVFISLSTFMNYAFGITNTYYKDISYNVHVYSNIDSSKEKYDKFLEISKLNNIKNYSIRRLLNIDANLNDKLTNEYKEMFPEEITKDTTISLTSIGDKEYRRYIKELGGKYQDYKDGIIYINTADIYYMNSEGKTETKKAIEFNEKDEITGTTDDKVNIKLDILKITDKVPMGFENIYGNLGLYIVSDEFIEKYDYITSAMIIDATNSYELCKDIEQIDKSLSVTNYDEEQKQEKQIVLLISIFLYGFIAVITLIGVTNIFNTITTNMNLRSKEFANLKSIGMTKKEFNKMINLESVMYGLKSLIIGISLGLGISYIMYRIVNDNENLNIKFLLPKNAIVISIIFIILIVGIIMRYSLNKINKQNIIETIRNDNI